MLHRACIVRLERLVLTHELSMLHHRRREWSLRRRPSTEWPGYRVAQSGFGIVQSSSRLSLCPLPWGQLCGGWLIAPATKGRSRWYNLKAGSIENATSCTSDCVPIPTNEDGCERLVIVVVVYSYGLASCDKLVCLFRCHRLVSRQWPPAQGPVMWWLVGQPVSGGKG